jgi:hypothetical protein
MVICIFVVKNRYFYPVENHLLRYMRFCVKSKQARQRNKKHDNTHHTRSH